ncbi:alpha/beta hydrolase [Candidatus Uabimicrobium sp. HlEnr_7]|uniref:alpha/beta hydrolase n=1 Tax=Candidatus Uabimicrobium helgolandensis TaxID=3095367 RepID=UPI003558D50F
MQPKIEHTHTQDNVRLALGRYKNSHGIPVILAHGLAQNSYFWDFPVEYHSFAKYLFTKGYDVWLPCLRGHGRGALHSDNKSDWSWNIDDLAIYDVPAIIEKVYQATEQHPFWVGHSMGGTLAYMYLQGAHYVKRIVAKEFIKLGNHVEWKNVHSISVSACEQKAHQRNAELRGLITVGSPVAMTWSYDPFLTKMMNHPIRQDLHILSFLSNRKLLRNTLNKVPYLPVSSALDIVEKSFGKWIRKCIHLPLAQIGTTKAFSLFWHPPNMNRHLIQTLMKESLNDVCSKVLEQFADWAENRTFRSFPNGNEKPHIYAEHFSKIDSPLLIVVGAEDKIAKPSVIYREGFLKMGSDNKKYKCFEKFGHNDLCMGLAAPTKVFPFIENWIAANL